MKVGDLVFSNGAIAIVVEDCHTSREMEHEDYVRLYYFSSRRFSTSYKWSVVLI